MIETDVAIIGAGPAGLMLAIELGCRGIPCVLFDINPTATALSKANATSARTMEHYRRRGFAHLVRQAGLVADHPQDVVYTTRLMGHELARFRIPSRQDAQAQTGFGDYGAAAWPTPELPHRAQQFYVEAILRAQVALYPSVTTRYGWRVEAVAQTGAGASLTAADLESGQTEPISEHVNARYIVGCDGPRSLVRKAMAASYEGASHEQREFFGGQMLSVQFRSPDFYQRLQGGPLGQRAWMVWVVNPVQRGILVAVNGVDVFGFGIQLKPGQSADSVDIGQVLRALAGTAEAPFTYEVMSQSAWTAGYTLVADQFRQQRFFIAGDAAHLFTPTGGMGYNTAVDDAVNLGWKLAAVTQGWAPDGLLDSYFAERHPIAQRNTRFARAMADGVGKTAMPPDLEADTAAGIAARQRVGAAFLAHGTAEFNIPGIQLGLRYASPIVAQEDGEPPLDAPNRYEASGYPGCRAPHVAMGGASALFDQFGRDFTLLILPYEAKKDTLDTSKLIAACAIWQGISADLGIPLHTLIQNGEAARQRYGAEAVLIRPDHHIAWRGALDADALAVLRLATAN